MKRVHVTRSATRDLDEIWSYVARDSVQAANRLTKEISDRFPLIGLSPEIGRARDEIQPGFRSHPVDNYVIHYRKTRRGVSIVRVIHGARNLKQAFKM